MVEELFEANARWLDDYEARSPQVKTPLSEQPATPELVRA
jgi:hypothetical protein